MSKESNLEFSVGLFVLTALVGLSFFVFSVSDSSVFSEGTIVKVIFNFANGIKKNAPVRVAGVDQGIVREIKLFFDLKERKTKVEVSLWIQKDSKIPADSKITVNQLGLMGEKYIEIIPGQDMEVFFKEGEFYIGQDPVAQEAISQRVLEVAYKLEDSIAGVNKIIHDERNRESITSILENLSSTTGSINDILNDMHSGKGTIGKLMYDDSLYEDIRGLSAELKENPWKLLYRPKDKRKRKRRDED